MALLQIAEPGQSDVPHQRRLAVGIDLGTTNSLVAAVRSGEATVLADASGARSVPSVVSYRAAASDGSSNGGDRRPLVGRAAEARASDAPLDTVRSAKRLMGKGLDDVASSWLSDHYRFDPSGSVPAFVTAAGPRTAIEVSAAILGELKSTAEASLGGELVGAVVTVPAYFDDAQRQATKDAAALAGLPVLRLLNEPTAAAVAYGLDGAAEGEAVGGGIGDDSDERGSRRADRTAGRTVVVYDLGGGTFDVSLLRLERGVFEVLATAGDTALGGDDMDNLLVERMLADLELEALPDAAARARAKRVAREAKEALSVAPDFTLDWIVDGERRVSSVLTRETFERLVTPLVERTLAPCRQVLRDAGVAREEIDAVVMVGGSTRVPLVRERVAAFFGREVLTDINPDEVVAIGAAIQADVLAGNRGGDADLLLLDVTPLSLGLETMGGLVERIVPRNTTIPVARGQEFTTYRDGQTALAVHVVQGERELVADCRSLARFELRGIPPRVAGAARVQVLFQVDADGLLTVSALERESGTVASVDVKPSYGLADGEIEAMLRASMEHAPEDMRARALAERRVEAGRALEAIVSALAADGDEHLDATERAVIEELAAGVRAALEGDDRDAIDTAIEALEQGSETFVERRMNASVRRLMAGREISEVEETLEPRATASAARADAD